MNKSPHTGAAHKGSQLFGAAMRTYLFVFAVLLTEVMAAPTAFAWADAGHRIVCQIAYLELKPAAREKVDALIALDPKFRTFSASCVWPDIFPAVRPAEHFLNVPRTATVVEASKLCPTSDRCVASAILGDARDLALSMDDQDKLRLLKSLGHWVGDIHQPLHVSFEDDKGGNFVAVSGSCAVSLHLTWDLCIIERSWAPTMARRLRSSTAKLPRLNETNGRARPSTPPRSHPGRA